ncbi:MAG: cold-shock protein [Acidimicrobiia bacterium]
MQGTIKAYDPATRQGEVLADNGEEIPLAPDALEGSIFRTLRQGQRVVFDLTEVNGVKTATRLRLGQDGR